MRLLSADTTPEAEAVWLERLRGMTPGEKLRRVFELNQAVDALAASRLRQRYGPELSERELTLRLASLRLDRETMIAAFGWDPLENGY